MEVQRELLEIEPSVLTNIHPLNFHTLNWLGVFMCRRGQKRGVIIEECVIKGGAIKEGAITNLEGSIKVKVISKTIYKK